MLPRLVSEPFARVIDRALQFRREDRYPSADVMLAAVKSAIAELEKLGARSPALEGESSRTPQEQPTIALSASDLEPWPGRSDAAAVPGGRRRRGSILPWVLVLFGAGVGAKLYVEWKGRTLPWPWDARPSPVAVGDGTSPASPERGRNLTAADTPDARAASPEASASPPDASKRPAPTTEAGVPIRLAPKAKPKPAPKASPKRTPTRPIVH